MSRAIKRDWIQQVDPYSAAPSAVGDILVQTLATGGLSDVVVGSRWLLRWGTTAAREASVGGRSLGAAYADEMPSLGNLKRMSESQLKRYGIDAHKLKDELLGGAISKFDIYRHGDDLYFVERSTGEVVPAYTTLER